jgi:hypothetical protein
VLFTFAREAAGAGCAPGFPCALSESRLRPLIFGQKIPCTTRAHRAAGTGTCVCRLFENYIGPTRAHIHLRLIDTAVTKQRISVELKDERITTAENVERQFLLLHGYVVTQAETRCTLSGC